MAADFRLFVVRPTDSLRTAMEKIEQNKHRVVVVVDEGRVLGTVSDGDIRRAYMHEVLAIAPVSQIMQLNPHVTMERDRKKRHEQAVREAAGIEGSTDRLDAVRVLLAEETRLGMLVGVAVGFELARELAQPPVTSESTTSKLED